jgi:hypothetical protein
LSVHNSLLFGNFDIILVVVLGVGAVRFSGGGETLPSSVARRLRVGGIFVYVEVKLQDDEWTLRARIRANSITLFTL